MKPWHEQDDFWESFEPTLFSQRRRSNAAAEVESIASLVHLQPGMRVLDLCCGIGMHSVELARRGYHVTGVDRTRSYLDKALRLAAEESLKVEFIQEDMRTFSKINGILQRRSFSELREAVHSSL
jgi:cyclopropane fatty-acyl-phospholipid synthase-like methyltransferase